MNYRSYEYNGIDDSYVEIQDGSPNTGMSRSVSRNASTFTGPGHTLGSDDALAQRALADDIQQVSKEEDEKHKSKLKKSKKKKGMLTL